MGVNIGGRYENSVISAALDKRAKNIEPQSEFVAELSIKDKRGQWTQTPVSVYYVAEPSRGYENKYFGMYYGGGGRAFICDATSAAEATWGGIRNVETGEIVFSRYRHDFRSLPSGGPAVDGGADYMRIVGDMTGFERVRLKVEDGGFVVHD